MLKSLNLFSLIVCPVGVLMNLIYFFTICKDGEFVKFSYALLIAALVAIPLQVHRYLRKAASESSSTHLEKSFRDLFQKMLGLALVFLYLNLMYGLEEDNMIQVAHPNTVKSFYELVEYRKKFSLVLYMNYLCLFIYSSTVVAAHYYRKSIAIHSDLYPENSFRDRDCFLNKDSKKGADEENTAAAAIKQEEYFQINRSEGGLD